MSSITFPHAKPPATANAMPNTFATSVLNRTTKGILMPFK